MILKLLLPAILLLPNGVQGDENFCRQKDCHTTSSSPSLSNGIAPGNELVCGNECDTLAKGTGYNKIDHLFDGSKDKCSCCFCPNGGVNSDPLFIGLRGQIFKFDGRSDAWYANISTKQLQWNVQFGQFSKCPKDRDMFVTATSMMFFDNSLFKKSKPSHSIVIKTGSKQDYQPGCKAGENVCLANGSLFIEIDGHRVTEPGDYAFSGGYGRVIAHNNFGACSRKWYDYRENKDDTDNQDSHTRKLQSKRPIDYLFDSQENVINPNECSHWLEKRIQNDDIFDQEGDWATIHIDTPLVSFYVEYRKNKNDVDKCISHSIDAWITRSAPELEEQKWHGILGETAEPKFDSDGHEVIFDREKLLSAKDDEAYEVDGEFGTTFGAQEKSWPW